MQFKRFFLHAASADPATPPRDFHAYVALLDPVVRPFAEAFYTRLAGLLPKNFVMDWDRNAPDNPSLEPPSRLGDRLSLEFHMVERGVHFKYGTGRVAVRDKTYFAKTVTWKTPKTFLHQPAVYQLIKAHYYACTIHKNRSVQGNGFSLRNRNQVITLEVFGEHPDNGYLACDITLSRFNQQMAQHRMSRFLNFYGELYNHLQNASLHFQSAPVSDVGFPELDDFSLE